MPPLGGIPFGTSNSSGGSGGDVTIELTGDVTGGPESGTNIVIVTDIANGAVTETKIADDAVTNNKIFPEAVTIDKMAPDSVGNTQLIDSTVGEQKMTNAPAETVLANPTGALAERQNIPFLGPARDIGAASSPAAVRTILGIRDIGDFRNWSIAQAKQRLGLATTEYPQTVIDEPFTIKPGLTPNIYSQSFGGVTIAQLNDADRVGGWTRITADSGGAVGGIYAAGFPPLLRSAAKWYVAALVNFESLATVNSDTIAGINIIDSGFGSDGATFGVIGGLSTDFISLRKPNDTTGSVTTVDIYDGTIVLECWSDGSGNVFLAANGTTAVSVDTSAYLHMCFPIVTVKGAEAGQGVIDIGHLVAITIQT